MQQPRALAFALILGKRYQMHAKDLTAFVDVDIEICMRRSEIHKLELFQKHRNLPDFGTKKVFVCVESAAAVAARWTWPPPLPGGQEVAN